MKVIEVFPDDGFWRARSEDGKISVVAQSLQDALTRALSAWRFLPAAERQDTYTLVLRAETD